MEPRRTRRRWRFGPFTLLAVLAAAFVIQARSTSTPALARPTASSPPPPLWKPEPSLILAKGSTLGVEPARRKRIEKVHARWRAVKAAMEADMRRITDGSTRLDGAMRASLQEYSVLSRRYDAERSRHWAEALALLTPAQRDRAVELRPKGEKR